MDDGTRRCALPGCDVLIQSAPGRPERRYCGAAHRAAARQARRAAAHTTTSADDALLAASLPWLEAPRGQAPPPSAHRPPVGAAGAGSFAPVPAPVGSPGPATPVPAGSIPSTRPPSSWFPETGGRPAGATAGPVAPSRRIRRAARFGRRPVARPETVEGVSLRRRALAVLGVAGIVVGGYAVTGPQPAPAPAPVQAAPGVMDEQEWAAEARIALASVAGQLDTIAMTQEAWNSTPDARRSGRPPAQVAALEKRRVELERRQLVLNLQLEAYERLQGLAEETQRDERTLRQAQERIEAAPPEPLRTPQEQAEIDLLTEERDRLLRLRDLRRDELAGHRETVAAAARTPIQDDEERTEQVRDGVMAVVEGRDAPAPDGTPGPRQPDVIGGRDEQGERPRADVDTSAPPDPRGPRDEAGERRGERGPVRAATDAVGGVLTGGAAGADAGRADDDGDRGHGNGRDRGGVELVADTVDDLDDAVDTVADTADDGVQTVADTAGGLTGGLLGNGGDRSDREGRSAPRRAPAAPRSAPAAPPVADRIVDAAGEPIEPAPSAVRPVYTADAAAAGIAGSVLRSVPGGRLVEPGLTAAIEDAMAQDAMARDAAARDAEARDTGTPETGADRRGTGDAVVAPRTLPARDEAPAMEQAVVEAVATQMQAAAESVATQMQAPADSSADLDRSTSGTSADQDHAQEWAAETASAFGGDPSGVESVSGYGYADGTAGDRSGESGSGESGYGDSGSRGSDHRESGYGGSRDEDSSEEDSGDSGYADDTSGSGDRGVGGPDYSGSGSDYSGSGYGDRADDDSASWSDDADADADSDSDSDSDESDHRESDDSGSGDSDH